MERHSEVCIAIDENVHNGIAEELKKVILMRYRTLNILQIAKQIISLVKKEIDILKDTNGHLRLLWGL